MKNLRSNTFLRVLCMLLALTMLFGLVSCKKKHKDPTEQFVSALNDAADEVLDHSQKNGANALTALNPSSLDNKKVSVTVQPVLGEMLGTMLGDELPIDVSVINNFKIGLDASSKGDLAKLGVSLAYADDPILALYGILDIKDLGAYVNVSEGTDKALFFDLRNLLDSIDKEMLDQIKNSASAPTADVKELIPIVTEYYKMIYANAADVTKEETDFSVGTLTADMTVLTWTASDKVAYDTIIAIVEKFVADERIKPLLEPFYQGEEDFDEAYAEIVGVANDFLEMEKTDPTEITGKDAFVAKLFVDKNNDIFGVDVVAYNDDGTEFLNFKSGSLKVGDNFAFELTANGEDLPKVGLSANGTNVKDILNGTVSVSYDGKQVAALTFTDCDNSKADKGITKGSVKLRPGSGLASLPDIDPSTAIAIGMFGLNIDFECDGDSSKSFISVEMNNANLAGIKLDVKNGEAEAITVPADHVTDPTIWLMSLDFNEILTALDDSALPDELVDMIKGLVIGQ